MNESHSKDIGAVVDRVKAKRNSLGNPKNARKSFLCPSLPPAASRTMASKLLAILFILSISGNAFGAPAASSSIKGEMDESLVFNYENYIRVSALVSLQSPNPLSLALPLPPADAYHSPDQV
jgi:hypothetical protein